MSGVAIPGMTMEWAEVGVWLVHLGGEQIGHVWRADRARIGLGGWHWFLARGPVHAHHREHRTRFDAANALMSASGRH